MRQLLVNTLGAQTKLRAGNPTLNTLVVDFDRLGVNVRRGALVAVGPASTTDLDVLDQELLVARNLILHGEARMNAVTVGASDTPLRESQITNWVTSLDRIAATRDSVAARDLTAPLGVRPW